MSKATKVRDEKPKNGHTRTHDEKPRNGHTRTHDEKPKNEDTEVSGQSAGSSVISTFSHADSGQQIKYQGEADISKSLILKAGNLFMLLNQRGDADIDFNQADGLYFHDCRFLSKFTLRLGDQYLTPLLSSAAEDEMAEFELVNPAMVLVEAPGVSPSPPAIRPGQPGSDQPTAQPEKIPAQSIGVSRRIELGANLTQTITVRNFNRQPMTLALRLEFDSDFLDIFTIRGTSGGKRGTFQPPQAAKNSLKLCYMGADNHLRTTTLDFAPDPDRIEVEHGEVIYQLDLEPHGCWQGQVTVSVEDKNIAATKEDKREAAKTHAKNGQDKTATNDGSGQDFTGNKLEETPSGGLVSRPKGSQHGLQSQRVRLLPLVGDQTKIDLQPYIKDDSSPIEIESPNQLFNRVLKRSFDDLYMLLTYQGQELFFAAGVPWFVTLFGRDSLITALETLAYNPGIAAGTLQLLAAYQGKEVNEWKDEQPGKILHELRVGERANLGEIPYTPYYGTVDSTPLFLILMGEYLRWTGDFELFKRLLENVRAALHWIDRYGDIEGDGFVEYASKSAGGLSNQGWKDSGNSIVNKDGSLVTPPVALVEVQGYVYKAKTLLAPAFRTIGDNFTAQRLEIEAAELKEKFNKSFWMPDEQYYALALQKGGQQAQAIASNPGQALWTGIVPPDRAALVRDRLMQPDMFNGWGIRTLSAEAKAYNPFDYQVGSVWPHDNSLIAAGLKQHGFGEEAARIMTGLFMTAGFLPDYRLPEVFSGVSREREPYPVKYPVACRPQAWAAGSIPFALSTILGLEPDLPNQALQITKPVLPDWLPGLTIYNLAVGSYRTSLEFSRTDSGTEVRLLQQDGDLKVNVSY
ncbi:MAG TPA: glycogen debranching N-terminal domain-containing protein [Chloroflexia bacterium]|nr:glycogen debranching N-terminal domain-containing protein [Chloroflexia bacterium]